MAIYQIEVIEPKAKRLLEDLVRLKLIKLEKVDAQGRFNKLLAKLRRTRTRLSIDEITDEVEAVRAKRYAKR